MLDMLPNLLSARSAEAEKEIALYGLAPRALIAVATIFLGLSMILLPARIYVRAGMLKSFGLDDWMLVAAFVSLVTILT